MNNRIKLFISTIQKNSHNNNTLTSFLINILTYIIIYSNCNLINLEFTGDITYDIPVSKKEPMSFNPLINDIGSFLLQHLILFLSIPFIKYCHPLIHIKHHLYKREKCHCSRSLAKTHIGSDYRRQLQFF